MQCKFGGNTEGLSTLWALVWFMASMIAQMHIEVGYAGESLATQLTVVRFFPRVCAQVFGEV